MPLASWLFIRNGESIWIERPDGFSMIVCGPGRSREHHDFDDEAGVEAFQRELGERLVDAGWFLWGVNRERRGGRDRRGIDRDTPDRREPIPFRPKGT